MMSKQIFIFLFILTVIASCKQSYEPAVIKANKNFLVVDGVINMGANTVTIIKLSRTRNVTDSLFASPEPDAQVNIIGSNGDNYPLHEQGNGVYESDALTLHATEAYALQITTSGNSQYLSDYIMPKPAPPIDSLQWNYTGDGVTIFLNTHDLLNNTKYYRWEFVETWEYHAPDQTSLGEKDGLIYYLDANTQTYTCWQTDNSTNIMLGSSVALAQDVISLDSITHIPQNDIKIGVRYSILVKQYALDTAAYQYWQLLQKNTQQLGSLFDAQPTQLTGNIHNTNNVSEPVLGYISASTIEEKRLFISNREVPGWNATEYTGRECNETSIVQNPDNYLLFSYPDADFAPYYFFNVGNFDSLKIARKTCVDCTLAGGTNQKPGFW